MEWIKRKLASIWTFWAVLNVVSVPILVLFGFFLFSFFFFFHFCMTTILQLGVDALKENMKVISEFNVISKEGNKSNVDWFS